MTAFLIVAALIVLLVVAGHVSRAMDADQPADPMTDPEGEQRCPECGGLDGAHGQVHVRHGNGGGHNEPCPREMPGPDDDEES